MLMCEESILCVFIISPYEPNNAKKEISNSNTSSRLSKQIHKIKIDGPKSPFVDYINNKMIPKFPQHYYDSANYP